MIKGSAEYRFWERLIIIEQKVANIIAYQKWQMGLLACILLAALAAAVK